jgi:hypothetical protein
MSGSPAYAPLQEVRCFVTVSSPHDQVRIRLWRGKTLASIRRACKGHYKGCRLEFGHCFYVTL